MITLRASADRGHFDFGWLDTYHSFSFGDYYDPQQMGFRSLRVINEDRVAGGAGFPLHPHREMEIVTYMLSGALEHKDSLGSGGQIRPGELQRMSAGTGIQHSEFNPDPQAAAHLLQIWLLPEKRGIAPSYEQRSFDPTQRQGRLRLLAAPGGPEGALDINQDVRLYDTQLAAGEAVEQQLAPGRHAWLQLARGRLRLTAGSGAIQELAAGDGAAVSSEERLRIESLEDAEALLFDLA